MLISPRLDFPPWSRAASITNRTAVYAIRTYGGVGGGGREPFSYPDHECVRYVSKRGLVRLPHNFCLDGAHGDVRLWAGELGPDIGERDHFI